MDTATTVEAVAVAAVEQSLFVTVPDVTLPNGVIVPSFQVGQYLCSENDDGKAVVTATGTPWVDINYYDAKEACEAAGFKLITELQCLAIAHDIANVGKNWTGGAVGVGNLKQGLRNDTVDEAQAGDYVPDDADEGRWFELSNGERICDASGNAFTWVFDDVQGDSDGLIAKPFADDSPSLTTAPYPSMEKGTGWRPNAGRDWSGYALVRGGYWGSVDFAGAFYLDRDWPDGEGGDIGFRCTK